MSSSVFTQVEKYVRKFGTRDPFELLDALHVITKISDAYPRDGLKGYCIALNRSNYTVINGNLSDEDQKVTASHELGHIVMHGKELRCSPFKDFNIYQATGRKEREANFFGADLLIEDNDVLDLIHSGNSNFFNVAKALNVPCEFLAFKLYSMVERGLPMHVPVDLDSGFLASKRG